MSKEAWQDITRRKHLIFQILFHSVVIKNQFARTGSGTAVSRWKKKEGRRSHPFSAFHKLSAAYNHKYIHRFKLTSNRMKCKQIQKHYMNSVSVITGPWMQHTSSFDVCLGSRFSRTLHVPNLNLNQVSILKVHRPTYSRYKRKEKNKKNRKGQNAQGYRGVPWKQSGPVALVESLSVTKEITKPNLDYCGQDH